MFHLRGDKKCGNLIEEDMPESVMKAWQEAHAAFLRCFPVPSESNVPYFSLRDIDGNGVPELIIVQVEDVITAVLNVYSYDDNVKKVGEYSLFGGVEV